MHTAILLMNYLPFLFSILGAIYCLYLYFKMYAKDKGQAEVYITYLIAFAGIIIALRVHGHFVFYSGSSLILVVIILFWLLIRTSKQK